jgi:hypothetical protein
VVGAVKVISTPAAVGPSSNSGIGPDTFAPSTRIAIVPAGWTAPGGVVATVTVNVTLPPGATGLVSLEIVVVVLARLTVWPTSPELAMNSASPL